MKIHDMMAFYLVQGSGQGQDRGQDESPQNNNGPSVDETEFKFQPSKERRHATAKTFGGAKGDGECSFSDVSLSVHDGQQLHEKMIECIKFIGTKWWRGMSMYEHGHAWGICGL